MKQLRTSNRMRAEWYQLCPGAFVEPIVGRHLFISNIGAVAFSKKQPSTDRLVLMPIGWDDQEDNPHTAWVVYKLA